ncbi:50S ribosomal protein L19e [Candidatus Woesearchaeota archaeon]|nr:50S ribosomal protein L19e [Candidatus Woesearchaeota archaeon]
MRLKLQKRLAGEVLKTSKKHIRIDPASAADVKEAITKADIRGLIGRGAIIAKPIKSLSRGRARQRKLQKSKGRRRGYGSRKGKYNARLGEKSSWMSKIRIQRDFLKELKGKGIITNRAFKELYVKAKGGFFRSKRHIKLYIEEHKLIKKKK